MTTEAGADETVAAGVAGAAEVVAVGEATKDDADPDGRPQADTKTSLHVLDPDGLGVQFGGLRQ